jgi:hypothetical protein
MPTVWSCLNVLGQFRNLGGSHKMRYAEPDGCAVRFSYSHFAEILVADRSGGVKEEEVVSLVRYERLLADV